MSNLPKAIAGLDEKKRELLALLVRQKGLDATLADITSEIEAAGRSQRADLPPLERAPRGRPLPAGLIPELMWHVQGGPVHTVYNLPFALRLRGELDPAALEAAVTALVARHEALRTRFEMAADGLRQEVLEPAPVPLPLVDLSALPADRREGVARALARDDGAVPFDMTRAPLFRVRLLRLAGGGADADHVLLYNLHHSIADGWSVTLVQRDVAVLYSACRHGLASPLPPLPLHYTDLAVWQRHAYEGPALEARLEYWRELFADRPPPFAVPADRPMSPASPDVPIGSRTHVGKLAVAGEEARRLRQRALDARCTVAMTLCALFEALVHRYNPRGDVVLTCFLAGRDRPELAEAIGPFLNVAPIRTDLSGEPTFRELLRRVRAALIEVYARQDLPFVKLVQGVLPDRPPSRTAFSRLGFNILSSPIRPGDARPGSGLRLETFLPAEAEAKYDVAFIASERQDAFTLSLTLAADLFEEASLPAMLDDLQTVLRNALNDPDTPVGALLPEPRYRPGGASLSPE
jgi:hypothetical protein